MAKSNTDQGQVGEIYTLPHCSMGIIHVGHYYAKGSERIHQARRYQLKVRVANQREHCLKQSEPCLKQSTQVFGRG